MSKSQNGYLVLDQDETFKWILPLRDEPKRHLVLKPGDAGFVLSHFALWYHERVQKINEGVWDEWGWAVRPIRDSSVTSNHASGTAIDLNATKHPLGVRGTLRFWLRRGTRRELAEERIRRILNTQYKDVIRAGLNYTGRPDEMHYEIVRDYSFVRPLAARLRKTRRGKRILKANPDYRPGIPR
jgi:hypothetical protein